MESTRIMVCEDELLFATELEQRLLRMGFEVTGIASDCDEALRLAEEAPADFALMDVRLRGTVSGTEVARILDSEFQIPSLFITAYSDADTLKQASKTNALGFLTKPVSDHDLEVAIRFADARAKAMRAIQLHRSTQRSRTEQIRDLLTETSAEEYRKIRDRVFKGVVAETAHHINNTLAALYGHLEILRESPSLPGYEVRQLRHIATACLQQQAFVQRLLWASEMGFYFWKVLPLAQIIDASLRRVRKRLPKGVEISFDAKNDKLMSRVCGDALVEAIVSVLNNSLRAMDNVGVITISLGQEQVEDTSDFGKQAEPGQYQTITITDSGPGIAPDDLPHVMEPFFTTIPDRDVPGLGLTVARGVLHAHGGTVRISSEFGSGTTVKLYLPSSEGEGKGGSGI